MDRRHKQPLCCDIICRQYLIYFKKSRQSGRTQIESMRRVIKAFCAYLEKLQVQLPDITIAHVDGFLAVFNIPYARSTRRLYRSFLRSFLRYLYNERNLLAHNLADLIIGPPLFAKAKPPKFLRPHEIRRLFDHLPYSTGCELRTYAMVHLAYFLGLRPSEISQITLDDISFSKAQLILRNRKNNRPLQLPIPENTLKAITAYIVGARPKTRHRRLFVLLTYPYRPISPNLVGQYLTGTLRSAGIDATAYWLRHTCAQNLLEAGAEIFEIKEMLGHDSIESTGKYLSIRDYTILHLLYDSGARAAEIASLRLDYFDCSNSTLAILGKANRYRQIELLPKTTALIDRYITKYRRTPNAFCKAHLFINQRGEAFTRHGINRLCKKYLTKTLSAKRLNLINPAHSFRHSCAVRMLAEGKPVSDIKNRLGHENVQSTMVYLQMDLSQKRLLQEKFIKFTRQHLMADPKIDELIQWENRKDVLEWLDSL